MDAQLSPPTTPQKPEIWENHFIDYESDNEESGSDSDSESESESESESSSYASQSFPSKPDAGSSGWPRKAGAVMLEGYVDGSDSLDGRSDGSVARTKSLTDDDLEELKGCLDLGFGFSYEEIPELCNTLPALELCYSMSQRFLDEKRFDGESDVGGSVASVCSSPSRSAIANWKISEPGDDPEEVKARLKYWAQAVACTVRLCNN